MKDSNVYCFKKYRAAKKTITEKSNLSTSEANEKIVSLPERNSFLESYNGMKVSEAIAEGILPPIPQVNIEAIIAEFEDNHKGSEFFPLKWQIKGTHCHFIRERLNWLVRYEYILDEKARYTLFQDGLFYATCDTSLGFDLIEFLTWNFINGKWELEIFHHLNMIESDLDRTFEDMVKDEKEFGFEM